MLTKAGTGKGGKRGLSSSFWMITGFFYFATITIEKGVVMLFLPLKMENDC